MSINSLSILLREGGFARLPRRKDDERPAVTKPEAAPVADVRELDLSRRSFRTRVAGLFLFVPILRDLDLGAVAREAGLPGSKMNPAEQALRSLLALKLIGKKRKSHVMNPVMDQGLALFAGLDAIPKPSLHRWPMTYSRPMPVILSAARLRDVMRQSRFTVKTPSLIESRMGSR